MEGATRFAHDIAVLLESYGFPVTPITGMADLSTLIAPFERGTILEVRQQESVVDMQVGEAYVVYPFAPSPLATMIPLFESLVRQQYECLVQIYLEPTLLDDEERSKLAHAAAMAASLADFQFEGFTVHGRQVDPQAGLVARLYRRYLDRFNQPFLLAIQVMSGDRVTSWTVAQAIGAEITETVTLDRVGTSDDRLPSGFSITQPTSEADWATAFRALRFLDLQPWQNGMASAGKERLPYLVDAETAAGAFRLPVALRGGVPGVAVRQPTPQFDPGPRSWDVPAGHLGIGNFSDRLGIACVPLGQLCRHLLVVGTNGSGKTTTCFHLLTQLWEQKIPFLVIEPAKTEYRTLLGRPLQGTLRVYTLGDESISPFRFNPFEILPGVRVEAHIAQIKACFEAALPTFGVLPSLIGEALERIYLDRGWSLTDRGRVQGDDDVRRTPTLGDLYFQIILTAEARGYSPNMLQDIRAAASGRIGTLLRGSKGRMLNTQRSIPIQELLSRPTVLELESLNDEEKSLVMLFLLVAIREHCQTTRRDSSLQHVTLIEEAHRVMSKTAHSTNREVSSDSRAEATAAFSAALAELRAYGESLIVADQVPGRLVEDALKNTNTKIVHRLPGEDDRRAIAGTMNMGPEQEAYVAKLSQGHAAFFTEGSERPSFIQIRNYREIYDLPERVPEELVAEAMHSVPVEHAEAFTPFPACVHCLKRCQYRDRVAYTAYTVEAHRAFKEALHATVRLSHKDQSASLTALREHCKNALAGTRLDQDPHAVYCYFAHHFDLKPAEHVAQCLRNEA